MNEVLTSYLLTIIAFGVFIFAAFFNMYWHDNFKSLLLWLVVVISFGIIGWCGYNIYTLERCNKCDKIVTTAYCNNCGTINENYKLFVCSNCNTEVDGEYCPSCGISRDEIERKDDVKAKTTPVCAECDTELSDEANFCPNCGTDVTGNI